MSQDAAFVLGAVACAAVGSLAGWLVAFVTWKWLR